VASAAAAKTFRFKNPYKVANNASSENGLNWPVVHMEYIKLHTVLTEAVAVFANLYAYGVSKCTFFAGLKGRPVHNLEDLECTHPPLSITTTGVHCQVTSFPTHLAQPKPRISSTVD